MRAKDAQAERACPGERYTISVAICRTRQRNQYPKCLLCPHRDPEVAGSIPSDPKVSSSIFHSTSVSGAVPNEKISWEKLGIDTPRFMIESDASIVAPLIFQYVLEG